MQIGVLRGRSRVIAVIATVILLMAAFVAWRIWARAQNAVMVIFTVQKILASENGTVQMQYHVTMKGSPSVFRLGKRSANSLFVYDESVNATSIADLIFGSPFGPDSEGKGYHELGKCDQLELRDAPQRIDLEPGESYILATCTEANGERVELFVSCQ
ncbi:MAG: hypothetical protein HOH82_10175 [Planctomycetaceae bacterium]|jgi:hypothetical protein|nr:hypothetical protein [Planctomycetaceae bacterium]